MEQVSIKYTSIFYCKTLQNLPKFGLKTNHLATLTHTPQPGYFPAAHRAIWDDVMIFEIFSPQNGKKLALFTQNIVFLEKRQFFRQKLAKIAENYDHNIDPSSLMPVLKSDKYFCIFCMLLWPYEVAFCIILKYTLAYKCLGTLNTCLYVHRCVGVGYNRLRL
jgi:hypothetical protein